MKNVRKNQAFIAFAECNRRKLIITSEIEKLQKSVQSANDAFVKLDQHRKQAASQVSRLYKEIHSAELELKSLDVQESEKKRRVLNTQNAKEYQSLLKEIDLIQEKKSNLEDAIFLLWEQLEQAKQNQLDVDQETEKEFAQMQATLNNLKLQQEGARERCVAVEQECEKIAHLVNDELFSKYRTMLDVVPNPAMPIEDGSCSACFYRVSRVDISKAEKGEIITCKDCYRLLYVLTSSLSIVS